jgi:hypothetical protein
MNRDIIIEDLKAEIANNSYRETPMSLAKVVNMDDVYEIIDEFKNDLLQNVSGCFMVHNKGIPMSYHKTEQGAKDRVQEWIDSGIEPAKTVDYHELEILE